MFGLPDTYRVNVDVALKDFIPKALKGRNDKKNVATCHEYLIIYGKLNFETNMLPLTEEQRAKFDKVDENGNKYQLRDLRK